MRSLPWQLAWARLRKYPLRNLSLLVIVALALSVMLGLGGISLSSRDSITAYSLAQLSVGDQNVTVNSAQILSSTSEYLAADKYVESHLSTLSSGAITHEAIYSELSDLHGIRFNLGAISDLKSSVRLISGRWPNTCTASQCEVLEVGGSEVNPVRPQAFGLSIVGVGAIVNNDVFAGTMSPGAGTSLLLTGDAHGIAVLPHFVNVHGTDAWVTKINISKVNQDGISAYIAQVVAFEDRMSIDQPNLILTWPQDALSSAGEQSDQFTKKSNLIGFAVISLLLAFVTIFSIRQRREQQNFRASLSRIGTSKATLIWETLLESSLPTLVGALLAIALSPLTTWILSQFNYHASIAQLFSNWSDNFFVIATAICLTAAISIFRDQFSRLTQLAPFVLSLALFGEFLSVSGVNDSRYLLIPFIYAGLPALLCYFCLHYLTRIFRRSTRSYFIIFREYLAIWRAIAVIVSLASILAMMALAFDSGISESINLKARDLAPLDVSIKTGTSLVKPLDIASPEEYSSLIPNSHAYPILRTGSSIRNQGVVSDSIALMGAPAEAIAAAAPDLQSFSRSLKPIQFNAQNSIPIGSSQTMSVELIGIPPVIDLMGWFITPRGLRVNALFTTHSGIRTLTLHGQVPPESSLIAFEFQESSNTLSRRLHAIGEGNYSVPAVKGIGSILKISLDGVDKTPAGSVWGTANFPFSFDGTSLYIRPKPDGSLPVVVTDPATAKLAENGLLTLGEGGNAYFQVKIGKVLSYFPSAGDRFVVMELSHMQNEIGKTNLGGSDPIELWVSTPDQAKYLSALGKGRFASLSSQSQLALKHEFASNPNSSGLIAAYRLALFFALILALFVSWSALPVLKRDGVRVLFYLESTGIAPSALRKTLQRTVSIAILVGISIGGLLGAVVSRLYISHSIPYANISLVLVATLLLTVLGMLISSFKFFSEKSMVS